MSLHTQSLQDYSHSNPILYDPSQDRLQRITIMEETASSEAASFHDNSADDIVELRELGDRDNNQPGKESLMQNIATHDDLRNSGSSNSLRTGDKEFLLEKFGPRPRMWNSTWLHLSVLSTFLGAFLVLLVIILVLYEVSVADNGLATQVQSRHYAWTYGPTAHLKSTYNSSRLVEKRRLREQTACSMRGASGWSFFGKEDIAARLRIASTAYVSSGSSQEPSLGCSRFYFWHVTPQTHCLIALEPTWVSKAGNPFSISSAFNATDFQLDNLTGTPGVVYYGIRTQSLPYPKAVEGFTSDLDCEIVQVDNSTLRRASLPWYSVLGSFFVADINAGNCSLKSVIVAETSSHGFHHNAEATQNFQGRMTNVTCSDGVDVSGWPTRLPDHSDYPDQRILMTMADLRWLVAAEDMGSKWQSHVPLWWIQNVTAVLCRPRYSLNMYQVDFPIGTKFLGDLVHAMMINESSLPLPGLLGAANNDSRQEAFMDPTVLRDIGSNVWNGVAAQLVYESMMQPTDDVVVGSFRYSENRLQVKLLSVILMMVALGFLCLLVVIVMLSRPWNVVPRDPFSISAVATLLAANPAIIKLFDDRGASRRSKLQEVLEDYSFENLVGKMPLHALVVSARNLDLGHSVSLLAVLVAAFLTIIVSGLFTAMPILGSSSANMTQIDRFDFVRENLSISDNNAGAITSSIEWSGLSSPDWTYNDLPFNRYELPESSQKTGIVTVDIPAYRARLDCDVILNKTYSVNVIVPRGDGGFGPQILWQQGFYAPKDYTPNCFGQAPVLQWEVDGGEVIGDGAIFASSTGLCQTVADGLNNSRRCKSDLHFVMCFQRLEMVMTSVTFNIPDTSINTTMPPKPDESTVTTIQNPATSNDVWEWSINTLLTSLGNGTNPSTGTVPAPPGGDPGYSNLDWFLDTIIEGKSGVRVTDLVDQGNTSRDLLIKSSQRLYGDYMAQAFSANMRDTTAVPNTTILARINDVPRWRLKQNSAPKIALQVILGFLAASAIATYLLLDMREKEKEDDEDRRFAIFVEH
ncbi:hypothetical protein E4T41_03572 [Aureobasidium subglaciale]|nr:hypothetical protein E4T41_03572 [Aureobasidium subglaciale]